MASSNRINLDPKAPDSLYQGAQKINAALDQADDRMQQIEKEMKIKASNSLCLYWMGV